MQGQCTSCVEGFTLAQGANGFYCTRSCNFPCSTCSGTSCLTCATGYVLSGSACVFDPATACNPVCETCPAGSYLSGTTCTRCTAAGCSTCASDTCSACFDGFFLSGSACNACPASCKTCSDATTCITCADGYIRDLLSTDSDPNSGALSPTCSACNSNCKTCSINADQCESCADGFRLRDFQCFGRNNVGFKFKFDTDYTEFLKQGKIETLIEKLAAVLGIDKDKIIINSLVSGSTVVDGSASADSNSAAITLANKLYDAVSANKAVLGFTATESSVGAYYDDSKSYDAATFRNIAGIIIGCSIAVGALIIIALIVVCCIRKTKAKPESQS